MPDPAPDPEPLGRDPAAALLVPVGTMLRPRPGGWHWGLGVVTDRWFDPVEGQRRARSGECCAIRRVGPDGGLMGRKMAQRLGGVRRYWTVLPDLYDIELARCAVEAIRAGSVVPISRGRVIRRRPKIPGL